MTTNINLAIAGATGWTGSAIALAALEAPDLTLKSAVARRSAGEDLGTALGTDPLGVPVHAEVGDALAAGVALVPGDVPALTVPGPMNQMTMG